MAQTKLDLASGEQVQGALPVANGGTGGATQTAAQTNLGLLPGTNVQAYASNLTSYAGKTAPSGAVVGTTDTQTLSGKSMSGSANTFTNLPASALTGLSRTLVPETITVSSATSLTLTTASSSYVFTGSVATTWTLPAVSGNSNVLLFIENRGSANISLVPAGTDHIWFKSSVSSMTVGAGGSLLLINDGTYWNALSLDLTNNAVGILPIANGGTGQSSLTSLALTTPTISGYTETVSAMGTVGSTATIPALSNGTLVTATLTASTATTFTMPTAAAGVSFVLLLKQAATTGAGTATFTGVKWSSWGTPVQTATAATMDMYSFISDGTDWYGNYSQGYVP